VIWLLVLAEVFLAPAVQTGYCAEDLCQSLMPRGLAVLQDETMLDVVKFHIKHTMLVGRFFPLTLSHISVLMYV
jgi:hypothetical protein